MKKLLPRIILAILLLAFFTSKSQADIAPPNPFRSPCPAGQKAYYCQTTQENYTDPNPKSNCQLYRNNPNFTLHSYNKRFNDDNIILETQYCGPSDQDMLLPTIFNPFTSTPFMRLYALALFGTLLLELITIQFFTAARNKKFILSFTYANIFSVFVLNYLLQILPYPYLLIFIIGEAAVILFEILFVGNTSQKDYKSLVVPILTANLISATMGTFIFIYILQGILSSLL